MPLFENKIEKTDFEEQAINLKIYIHYNADDKLDKVSHLIMNLDPEDKILILCFRYVLTYEGYVEAFQDFVKFSEEIADKDILYYLNRNHKTYFKTQKLALESGNEENSIELEDKEIRSVINLQTISAKRGVANPDGGKSSDKTLSKLSSNYYNLISNPNLTIISELEQKIIDSDIELTKTYKKIFKPVIDNIKKFSSSKIDMADLKIQSSLEEKNILKENTEVIYTHQGQSLPEDYNGLGYLNLFAILFNIHIKIDAFKRIKDKSTPSEINILFIEEPEAHTHPQMQYVFIKNIKDMLDEASTEEHPLNLQTIITTHSSHISSQSDFNDIKYFLRKENEINSKNLSQLETEYGDGDAEKRNLQFLKQYLTLHRSELFFTDKLIFIEGDTERILLPVMMKKLDFENKEYPNYIPLLTQHISIIEIGAYSKVFDRFLDFLDIRSLIITDLDSVKKEPIIKDGEPQMNEDGSAKMSKAKAHRVEGATETSNASITHFLPDKDFNTLKDLNFDDKVVRADELCIVYQTEEDGYHARSFEDSFIHINRQFLKDNKAKFNSLKRDEDIDDDTIDAYDIAENCIKKKTLFATDVLYFSGDNLENWKTPNYIKKGLLWLSNK